MSGRNFESDSTAAPTGRDPSGGAQKVILAKIIQPLQLIRTSHANLFTYKVASTALACFLINGQGFATRH